MTLNCHLLFNFNVKTVFWCCTFHRKNFLDLSELFLCCPLCKVFFESTRAVLCCTIFRSFWINRSCFYADSSTSSIMRSEYVKIFLWLYLIKIFILVLWFEKVVEYWNASNLPCGEILPIACYLNDGKSDEPALKLDLNINTILCNIVHNFFFWDFSFGWFFF